MENYGLTVRQIRLSKGFSLKEIYTGILASLDNGKHTIE